MNNLEVVQAFAVAVLGDDMERVAQLTHSDFVVFEAASLPYGGEHRGVEGFFAMFGAMHAAWRGIKVEPLGEIGESQGNVFAMHMLVKGRMENGKPMASEVFERWEVRDGKVAEIRPFYWDTAALIPQLAMPNP